MGIVMDWQQRTGNSWAELYRQTDRSFGALTERLLDAVAHLPGEQVMDIGCGAGEISVALARSRPRAQVIGVDVSPALIAVAAQHGGHHANLDFELGDAAAWRRAGFSPDLLVSRHGVMFFGDPVLAFAHLHDMSRPGARLVFSCFRSQGENRWMADLAAMVPKDEGAAIADPHAPGPFAFADPRHVEDILSRAGWAAIDFEPVDFAYIAGAGPDPKADAIAFFSRIGPAAAVLAGLDPEQRDVVLQHLEGWVEAHLRDHLVAFRGAAWIVSARKG